MYHSEFYKNVVAVTNRSLCERPFLEQIERVCACHPKALILREKDLPEEEYFLLAKEVLGICRQYPSYLCGGSQKTGTSLYPSAIISP